MPGEFGLLNNGTSSKLQHTPMSMRGGIACRTHSTYCHFLYCRQHIFNKVRNIYHIAGDIVEDGSSELDRLKTLYFARVRSEWETSDKNEGLERALIPMWLDSPGPNE